MKNTFETTKKITEPFDKNNVDLNILRGMDTIFERGTHGQVKTTAEVIERLAKAEKHLSEHNIANRYLASENISNSDDITNKSSHSLKVWTSKNVMLRSILEINDLAGLSDEKKKILEKKVDIWTCNQFCEMIPDIRKNFIFDVKQLEIALYCIETQENFTLHGPPGCGKSVILEQIAARLGRPYYRISINGEMRSREIIGGFKQSATDKGSKTVWYDGLLSQGITEPSIINLDEIDRGDPDLLYAAHQTLERKGITILEDGGRHILMHPYCSIASTANTKGKADINGLYASINEMSEATRDRIGFWIECDYLEEDEEAKMLKQNLPNIKAMDAAKIAKVATSLRISFKNGNIRTACSTRQTLATAKRAISLYEEGKINPLRVAMTQVLENRATNSEDQNAIKALIRDIMDKRG